MQPKFGERLRQLRRFWHMPSAIGRIEAQQHQSQRANEEIFDYVLRRLGRLDVTTENIQRALLDRERSSEVASHCLSPNREDERASGSRIAATPFVLRALAGLLIPSHVLCLGQADSLLALQLASLGHDVTISDEHGSGSVRPQLRMTDADFAQWSEDNGRFDAIVFSTMLDSDGDLETPVISLLRFLRPGGQFVLSAYREQGLALMAKESPSSLVVPLKEFTVCARAIAIRDGQKAWRTRWDADMTSVGTGRSESPPSEEIVLIHATRLDRIAKQP